MKLKSRLRISTGIAVVLSIITGIITMFVSNNINEMSAKNIYLDEISKATFELSIITDEYFISRGEDTKQEWLRKYDDIGNSLQSERLMFKDPGCVSIMNLLTDVHEKLGGDFAAIDKMDMRKSGTEDITGLSADVKNRYADSLFEKLSTIVFQADRLEDLNHSNMISIQNKAVFLTAFSILFMTLIVFALMVVIEKTVINPVIRLKKAIGDIASGKMDHHSVSTHTRDEIGELSGSFDELSRKLKTTMVSRDKLAEEIAERIKAEKALHLSESKHRELIKNIPQKIFYKDKDSRYILCNESYASDLGMTPEELVGKTDYDLYPKELARKYREDDKSVLSSGTIREVDEKYIKDGKEAQVHTVKTPVKDGNGDVTGLFGIFWDITYRKQSEKEILELSKFPSENPNPVLRVKKDGTILYANKSGRALLDFYGLETGRIMPPDLKRDIEEISRTGRNSILELKIYDRIFEIAVTPVKGSDYVNMYGRDISERKRSEEELRKSEERYALAEEAAKVGSWDWDIQKGLLYWSDRIEPMFGFEPGEFGRTYEAFLECIHPEDRQHVMDAVDESLKNGSDYNIEHRIIWPDQSIHWVSEKGNVYFGEPSGKPVRMIGLVQDITDRKNGEEELRKAVNIKSTFTSMVSHELRTPLASIKAGINLLLDGFVGEINPEQQDMLDIAKRNVDRLNRLINDVLDFQKLDAGIMKFDMEPHSINSIIKEAYIAMKPVVEEKGLKLAIKLDDNIPDITVDRDKIMQVLTNLINNSIKFTDKGKIELISSGEGRSVNIKVKDTGIGVREEDMPRLFKSFEQLDNIKNRKYKGTGLGLAISKQIIKNHNGRMWAESEYGEGSVFQFTLPA